MSKPKTEAPLIKVADVIKRNNGNTGKIKRVCLSNIQANVAVAPRSKFMQNIGGLNDVPTGSYKLGPDGQYVCRGGFGAMMGYVGASNSSKTTIADWEKGTAAGRVYTCVDTAIWDYDTEGTAQTERKLDLLFEIPEWKDIDVENEGIYKLTDKTNMLSCEWFEKFKEVSKNKRKNRDKKMVDSPYWNAKHTGPLRVMYPTFFAMDSITKSSTKQDLITEDKVSLDDNKARTMYMNAGFAKARMVSALSTLTVANNCFITITAHVGDAGPNIGGNPNLPPKKKIQTMRSGDRIKGVTDEFIFLMTVCWQMFSSKLLNNSGSDRTPKYPMDPMDAKRQNTDLQIIDKGVLRSKTGGSYLRINQIVSQTFGVLPELSEYHNIKFTMKDFGIENGSARLHNCVILPNTKFSRTTIRTQLKQNPVLARAVNILSEMSQIIELNKFHDVNMVCTPETLYRDLVEMGYDWDKILLSRGWHTVNNGAHPIPTLTTYSIMCIRTGELSFPQYMVDKKAK